MDSESEISAIQRQIDELKFQLDELKFKEETGLSEVDYSTQLERLQSWCEEMILDHHKISLVDRISNKCYYYSDIQKREKNMLTEEEKKLPEMPIGYSNRRRIILRNHYRHAAKTGPSFEDFENYTRTSQDKVFQNDNFKIFIINEGLKRRQREEISETINTLVLTGEFIYYEF